MAAPFRAFPYTTILTIGCWFRAAIMGNSGRFGKYGDQKRIKRLKDARISSRLKPKSKTESTYFTKRYKKKESRKKPRISIRPATALDGSYIGALSKKVFQKYGPYEHILPRWFESGITFSFIAKMEGIPVGFAMLGQPCQNEDLYSLLELLAIAVDPGNRRLGIGDLLLKAAEKSAAEKDVEKIILHTAVRNFPGRTLFQKHGFVPLKIKKNFYPKGQDAVFMYKDMS